MTGRSASSTALVIEPWACPQPWKRNSPSGASGGSPGGLGESHPQAALPPSAAPVLTLQTSDADGDFVQAVLAEGQYEVIQA